ncbi:MAG: penicillin-binding protein 2 [Oligoflexales bacterium]
MSRSYKQESPLIESRFLWSNIFLIGIFALLTVRLWYIQIYKGETYRRISENNRIRRIEVPAPRGMIFDRYGSVVLGNRPFFDLVYIPQYVKETETTLQILSQLLHEPTANFERMLRANRGRPKFLPTTLKRNLSIHEVSLIEANKVFLPGIEINVAPRRDYKDHTPAHIVGYMGEISSKALRVWNDKQPENPYLPGDLIGKQGLEYRWESLLRGKRGYRLIQVDAFGRQTSLFEFEGWHLPIRPAVPGSDLILTLDMELQKAAEKAFQGKYGAVVVLDPQTGEILALISSPGYNPAIYQEGLSVDKWQSLISDPFKPLFDKTTGGSFPPGSLYKPVVAFAALGEGIIKAGSTFPCGGAFELGRDVFHCHHRGGHGQVDLRKALVKSCDIFFYNVGVELGADKIAKYAMDLGLGEKLGVRLNKEDPGLIPTNAWKKMTTKMAWALGDIPPLSIGQGANLLTPVQIASLYGTIANGGKIWRPFVVRKVVNHVGETVLEHKPELLHTSKLVTQAQFKLMRSMLRDVVMSSEGTGRRARVAEAEVAGKTGSVQVVSLKKNRSRKTSTVSMKWQEHAMFAAFSPVENAKIAVAIVSENDRVGGGGSSAAPVAKKIIEAFWRLRKTREKPSQLNISARPKPNKLR